MRRLLLHGQRPSTLKASTVLPSLGSTHWNKVPLFPSNDTPTAGLQPLGSTHWNKHPSYSTKNSGDTSSQGITQKARSTAEEFARQAKEKTDSLKETAKKVWEDTKETGADETQVQKDKFKERVEKGNYDEIGPK